MVELHFDLVLSVMDSSISSLTKRDPWSFSSSEKGDAQVAGQ